MTRFERGKPGRNDPGQGAVQRDGKLSRRSLLSAGAVLGSALALEGAAPSAARTVSGEIPWQPGEASAPEPVGLGPYQFLTADEASFVDAAVSRLIPNDDLGPGAKEAGVTTFIDRQLAGAYGQAATWYMQGPWRKGEDSQGYQSRLTPAQLYRAAIKDIDDHCRQTFQNKAFRELSPDDQDQVLKGLESGDIKLANADAKTFFTVFLQNTTEGFFADPIYGGNRDMAGWKLIGFPGARYDYRPYVSKHNQKLDLPPVGLKGRPEWEPHS
jgi:gluconate 2-dehydrogenase gamma chain